MAEHNLGSGPIQANLEHKMNKAGAVLDEFFNEGMEPGDKREFGFILMVFRFGVGAEKKADDRCNYISTANREDVITLLKEQLSYFQGMPDELPTSPRSS